MRRPRAAIGGLVVLVAALSIGLNADLHAPPRFDGAGYSILARSLVEGRGYREINRPGAPKHGHYPPGYPLALAGLWRLTGPSVVAAHLFSIACTTAAAWLAWRWFRSIEPRGVADLLGFALAVNWTWGAVGGSIQSESLYLFLSMLALNVSRVPGRRAAVGQGVLIGLCALTRHVGICLLAAVVIDRLSRKTRRRDAAILGIAAVLVLVPWVAWLAGVRRDTQVGLLDAGGIVPRVASQTLFYARRIPDALTGPFVEVATVFARSKAIGVVATLGAAVVSTLILMGLIRTAANPRRRLAGLVPLATLPLLLVWPFTEAGRFLIPLVPFLLVGMVEGLAALPGLFLRPTPHPNPPPQGGRGPDFGRHSKKNPPPSWGRAEWGVVRTGSPRHLAAFFLLLISLPYPTYAILTHRAEAQRRTHADFDAACAWIAREARRPGPVLTRHGGEVFWQTGRLIVSPNSDDLGALARQVRDQDVAYILVDADRYANAPPTPLARLVEARPGLATKVFAGPVAVYEVRPDSGP